MYKRLKTQAVNRLSLVDTFKVRFLRAYWYNYILLPKLVLQYLCFFTVPSIFLEHIFWEHFYTIASISLTVKDSIVTIKDIFEDCIVACGIENHLHAVIS